MHVLLFQKMIIIIVVVVVVVQVFPTN